MAKKEKTSEFGVGFIYNLFLFAKHYERAFTHLKEWEHMREVMKIEKNPNAKRMFTEAGALSLWFNGAGDHMYDLQIPEQWKRKKIGKLAEGLQAKALTWRMSEVHLTKKSFDDFWKDLELLTRLIDVELGVESREADNA